MVLYVQSLVTGASRLTPGDKHV